MNVVGLDLSITATGIAQQDGTLATYRPASKGDRRLVDIRNAVWRATVHADLVVLEAPFASLNGSGLILVGLNYVARTALISNQIPYVVVPPSTLKVYATGSGKATKSDMRMELYKRTTRTDPYDTDERRTHGGVDCADDNQVDAAWLRLLGLDLAGIPALSLPQTHRRALAKLALPANLKASTP